MIVAFGNFSGVVWTENISCVSQSENAVLKFLRRNIDGAWILVLRKIQIPEGNQIWRKFPIRRILKFGYTS